MSEFVGKLLDVNDIIYRHMKKYICPMHADVQSDKPGRCLKCGMALVEATKNKDANKHHDVMEDSAKNSYTPLIVIVVLIALATIVLSGRDYSLGTFSLRATLSYFMAGFFLVFSAFKLMDLKGFAEGYSMYDLLAKRVYAYGYAYPFLELFLGLAFLAGLETQSLLIFEILLMTFSGIGVLIKMSKKEKFQCACLGTFLKVPLTKVTLIEDFGMAMLGIAMLFL
jgi:hypothetical protein